MRITIAIGGNELVRQLMEQGEIRIEETDLLYAAERQKTRILERTMAGKDYMERPFAPYSETGPYYYYPQTSGYRFERVAVTKGFNFRVGGGNVTRSGLGIRYDSYGAFKRALGRTVVDLMGPRAPHMLQALVAQVQQGPKIVIGIWGPEAARADAHNEGIPGRLPQRRFLDVSPTDLVLVGNDIADAMATRLTRVEPRLLQ